MTPDKDTGLLKAGNGLVIIKNEPKNLADYPRDVRERYFWIEIMKDKDMAKPEGCQGASWIITPEEAQQLDETIRVDKANPPSYLLPGDKSLLPKSSSQSGHNCFTWSRQKILSLKSNKKIQEDERLKSDFLDFAYGSRTTRHLKPRIEIVEAEQRSGCRLM